MEHSLLAPHRITLQSGIPFSRIRHLLKGRRYHDANLSARFQDNEIDAINDLEDCLGPLDPEALDLRVAADCCCIWRYDYPQNVHRICDILGGRPRTALRLHYQICPERRRELSSYALALKGWAGDADLDKGSFSPGANLQTARKVYAFLGEKNKLKTDLVQRTYLGLASRFLNCSFWGACSEDESVALYPYHADRLPDDWYRQMAVLETRIRREMGSHATDFLCDVGGAAEPACHFKFTRRIDILVSSIGVLQWRGNLPEKDPTITGRRTLTQRYLTVFEKYWRPEYSSCTDGPTAEIERDLFARLGEPNALKKWLVASLWKNIKNQTQHHAYPMRRWVEFVRIGEDYLKGLSLQGS